MSQNERPIREIRSDNELVKAPHTYITENTLYPTEMTVKSVKDNSTKIIDMRETPVQKGVKISRGSKI